MFAAGLIWGDLSNLGYFNPAIVIGVLIQQYDNELVKFRRGFVGLLENIKFCFITFFVQLCGCMFGLFLWKIALFEEPNETKVGIWLLCPPNHESISWLEVNPPVKQDFEFLPDRPDFCG